MSALYQTEAERAREVPAGDAFPGLSVYEAIATGARSEKTGKPFGPAAWRDAGMRGSAQTCRSATDAIRSGEVPPLEGEPTRPAAEPVEPAGLTEGESGAVTETEDEIRAHGTVASPTRPTQAEMFERWGVDPEGWRIKTFEARERTANMKLKRRRIEPTTKGGERVVRLDDEKDVTVLWYVRVVWEPKHAEKALHALADEIRADLRAEARALPTVVPLRRRGKGPGLLQVLHCPDLHAEKAPWDGSAWDAPAAFMAATDELLEASAHMDTGRVLITVGNDAMNTDGSRRATTRSTPQDNGHRWRDGYRAVKRMYRYAIRRALEVAPVTVVVVPGNHDKDACFYLGENLADVYEDNTHVSFVGTGEEADRPRHYYLHGRCLLGLTHGEGCAITDLPRLMSEEAAREWAEATAAREWLTGHRHKLEVQTIGSCVVRTSTALSPVAEWGKGKGYGTGRRAGELLSFHPEAGRIATYAAPFPTAAPERMAA